MSVSAIMLGGFSHFDQAPLSDISGNVTRPSHVLYFGEHQFVEHALKEDY